MGQVYSALKQSLPMSFARCVCLRPSVLSLNSQVAEKLCLQAAQKTSDARRNFRDRVREKRARELRTNTNTYHEHGFERGDFERTLRPFDYVQGSSSTAFSSEPAEESGQSAYESFSSLLDSFAHASLRPLNRRAVPFESAFKFSGQGRFARAHEVDEFLFAGKQHARVFLLLFTQS
jgi:hypothetical protein